MRKLLGSAALTAGLAAGLAATTVTASACGGLVAPNGAVRLARATTFVAWHDGVEHYMTSFAYQGDIDDVGWLVPLPAVPDKVEEGGGWTLQRLNREARPLRFADNHLEAGAAAPLAAPAEVLLQTQVRALDITVLRGSGQAVVDWCAQNNFVLPAETRAHILAYAHQSPVFMAAKYDVRAARLRGQFTGDGTPVLITMHTPRLWVPLEVLANENDPVDADVFLLTDSRPTIGDAVSFFQPDPTGRELPGAPGFTVIKQEPLNPSLQRDLSSDKNMSWVPDEGWFTALTLSANSRNVTYDMTVLRSGVMRLDAMATSDRDIAAIPGAAGATASDPGMLAAQIAGLLAGSALVLGLGALLLTSLAARRRARAVQGK